MPGAAARSEALGSPRALHEALEAVQPALPVAAVGLDPLARLAERHGRAERAFARPAHLLGLDEAGALQDPDVLLDSVERQARRPRELAQRRGAAPQALEDAPPRGVREREERRVER